MTIQGYILVLIILTLIASTFSTVIGFGTGTIMVPLLLFFLPLGQVYLLTSILQLCSSLWKTWIFWPFVEWSLVVNFGLPATLGALGGSLLLFKIPLWIFYRLFGLILIGNVIFLWYNPVFKLNKKFSFLIGILFGFLGGLFGIRGPLRSAFLTTVNLPKKVYLCTSGVIGILIDVIRIVIYLAGGMRLDVWLEWSLVLLIPCSFFAALLGTFIVKKIPQQQFRLIVMGILLIVGIKFLIFG